MKAINLIYKLIQDFGGNDKLVFVVGENEVSSLIFAIEQICAEEYVGEKFWSINSTLEENVVLIYYK